MSDQLENTYKKYRRRNGYVMIAILLFMILSVSVSVCIGGTAVGWQDVKAVLLGKASSSAWQIIVNLRLPRIVAALVCGWALAISGCVMQIILRNPLASPYTLGLSNAAAFGASLAIVFGSVASKVPKSGDMAMVTNPYLVTVCAFACSLFALMLILLIARSLSGDPQTIILAGIIISSIFGAALSGMQYVASATQLASIVFWSFGDLGHTNWTGILINCVLVFPASACMYFNRWNYRAISAGDEYAQSIGVNPNRTRMTGLTLATLCTSVVVSFFGVIAFIGLVVPHMVRRCIGNNEEFLIPVSALFGATFLLICDTLARTVLSPIIIPVGIITSIFGAPFFLFILLKRRRSHAIH